MIAAPQPSHYTPEEYLALEAASETKHEYLQDEIYATAGAGNTHILIVANLVGLLRSNLRGSQCGVYPIDAKVFILSQPAYFYPDVVISCHPQDRNCKDDLKFPSVIIEVISNTIENFDCGRKFQAYKTIPSLDYYLLVSQTEMRVDVYQRQGANQWLLTTYGHSDQLQLFTFNFSCPIQDIYEDVPDFFDATDPQSAG